MFKTRTLFLAIFSTLAFVSAHENYIQNYEKTDLYCANGNCGMLNNLPEEFSGYDIPEIAHFEQNDDGCSKGKNDFGSCNSNAGSIGDYGGCGSGDIGGGCGCGLSKRELRLERRRLRRQRRLEKRRCRKQKRLARRRLRRERRLERRQLRRERRLERRQLRRERRLERRANRRCRRG
ncbi:hypothetical protein AYI68_g5365 [Smittium mucronatum]|uniref:Uncharacterized protein n=1 Tax=Smittium mucronatum TaxID=133383 RepID=A0A1R0GUK9_9FUNG|nr:hypothetical protein AYI68_g5365 [Smittium mucronatum]